MNLKKNSYFKLLIIVIVVTLIVPFNIFAIENQSWNAKEFTSVNEPSISYFDGVYVLATDSIYTSNDFENWNITFSPDINGNYNQVHVLNGEFIASGKNVQPVKSKDGVNWLPLRLHENIAIKDIKTIGNTYFSISSSNEFLYSNNLLTWVNVPLASGEKFISSKFINDKCFIETSINEYNTNYWIVDKDLSKKQIDKNITSIDDICFLPQINTYIKIVSLASDYAKELYCLTSSDGVNWKRSGLILDKNQKSNIQADTFNIISLSDKVFLNIGNEVYVTSDASNWTKISNYGSFKNLKYNGEYFYNINNLTDLFISEDGVNWKNNSLPDKLSISSNIDILQNRLVIINTNFNNDLNVYESTMYSYVINNLDESIPDTIEKANKLLKTDEVIEPSEAIKISRLIENDEIDKNDESNESIQILPETKIDTTKTMKLKIGSENIYFSDNTVVSIGSDNSALPLIENGNTLVPIRPIIINLNGSLSWNDSEKKATLICNNATIELWVDSSQAKVNGENLILPMPFRLVNGKAIVALRPIIESLGYNIEWIDNAKEILIIY